MRFLLLVALAALLALPSAASAATVRMSTYTEREVERRFGNVEMTAAPGEVNTVQIDFTPALGTGDAVVITDTTAPLTAGARCENVNTHSVRCQDMAVDLASVTAALGDMADTAQSTYEEQPGFLRMNGGPGNDRLSASWAHLNGGEGDDTLTGRNGIEDLQGGPGGDVLEGHGGQYDYLDGGTGDDVLIGGEGNDLLRSGGNVNDTESSGVDRLDGGPGNDFLSDEDELGKGLVAGPDTLLGGDGVDWVQSYLLSGRPVKVDLRRTTGQGRPGENDTLVDVENVDGGYGPDTLIGNYAPNRLDGDRGRDVMRGGGGDDTLHSTVSSREFEHNRSASRYGPDRVFGDGGDDAIETLPTMESRISCGSGDDTITLVGYASEDDRAPSSLGPLASSTCDRLTMRDARPRSAVTIDPFPVRVTRDSLVLSLLRFRCCQHVMQIKRRGRPSDRVLATSRLRSRRIRLRVGRDVIAESKSGVVTFRGKITKVAVNRFVWRFQLGRGRF